jgi:hypothetical protein
VSTVLVAGLGDLGSRVLDTLARSPNVGRLVGASRNVERGEARVAQCRLVAALQGGPQHVEFERLDLADIGAAAALLRRLDPDVVVTAATRHTWWRGGVEGVPYGAWLPLQLTLVRDLMRAKREAGIGAPVVCLPFPDAVGPALAPLGLAPEIGAGNVGETAPKLALLSGGEVRLVMHHAAQRHAFPAFSFLGAGGGEEPPWAAEVLVDGRPLPLNARAGRWDGLEAVEADGTLVFTEAIAESTERVLGIRIARVAPAEMDDVALELERARDVWNAST